MPDNQGRLWFAGNNGIFEVSQRQLEEVAEGQQNRVRAVFFGRNEGLPNLQANFGYGPTSTRTRDDRICFSMLTGLAVVFPDRILVNPQPPPVVIEGISVDGRRLTVPGESELLGSELKTASGSEPTGEPEVPPQHHELKIDFSALSFVSPENVHFRYQLEGYSRKWIETTQRRATYSQMPPGQYRFHVVACNNSGVWNQSGAVLSFVVRPFFWQTWWFRLGLIIAFTISTAAIVYYISFRRLHRKLAHLEQETAVQKDRARIAKDLHDDLGAHLSQIAMLSELAQADLEKPAQASNHIDQIFRNARLLTRSLDEIVWAVNPRNDSLDRFVG
ncbi:MAG TPA: triple tyrosine motif-containing protein, partial [Verrucomicrobiae bacterium]|nr:triple tyrosine motif-containing protein [Verrucomicrobiae bacterium]